MRKDWSRCGLSPLPNVNDIKLTERLFGSSFLESAFGNIILAEESLFINENFEITSEVHLVDDYDNYMQDGEYQKKEITRDVNSIKDEVYYREFSDWRERGFRLWTIYPSASSTSPIVKAWHSEIFLLRKEFEERSSMLPF